MDPRADVADRPRSTVNPPLTPVNPNTVYLRVLDVDDEAVDGVGVGRVVIGGLPAVVGDVWMFDLIDEHGAPSLRRVGGQRPIAGGPGRLVGENFGSAVFPAQGMRAQQSVMSVVAGADGSPFAECSFENVPCWRSADWGGLHGWDPCGQRMRTVRGGWGH